MTIAFIVDGMLAEDDIVLSVVRVDDFGYDASCLVINVGHLAPIGDDEYAALEGSRRSVWVLSM